MSLPSLAPVPPTNLRAHLTTSEWDACLDAWSAVAQLYLRQTDDVFASACSKPGAIDAFLVSWFHEVASDKGSGAFCSSKKAIEVSRIGFLLTHRTLCSEQPPPGLLNWGFLADVAHAFPHSNGLRRLLESVYTAQSKHVEASLQKLKSVLTKELDSARPEAAEPTLKKIGPLLHASPSISTFFMVGADFLDSLASAYLKATSSFRARITAVTYLGLTGLVNSKKQNYSLLSDHLYTLKTQAEAVRKSSHTHGTLLADLVTNTSFLSLMQKQTASEAARAKSTAASLTTYRQASLGRPRRPQRTGISKGKEPAPIGSNASGEMHMHKMSLVTQIQDLFPDLGDGFVLKLLGEYKDDVEQVTAHLLDDSLPAYLKAVDRSEETSHQPLHSGTHYLEPRSTPPPQSAPLPSRRNIYDDDEFDRLAVDVSKLHFGRKDQGTADNLLSDRSAAPQKAAILSALAAFDSDDDERDDTYDAEDVGGTVDAGTEETDTDLHSGNEEALFKAYTSTPALFARDALTRRSKEREILRASTGMTDEAIEGWAVMVQRDPKRLRKLEARFSTFAGQQNELVSTAWRVEDEDGSGAENMRGRDGFRGRGRGRGRGGRGGVGAQGESNSGAGASGTARGRARNETNKASRANHNRRAQRAKKMARAGFPG